jgi:hypothetical protein
MKEWSDGVVDGWSNGEGTTGVRAARSYMGYMVA